MHVNSISAGSSVNQSFGQSNIERLANLSEEDIRKLSYKKASHDVNDKKHKRITNTLYYSLPLAAGIAAAIRNPGKAEAVIKAGKKATKNINLGRAIRFNNFVSTVASWGVTLLAVDAIFGGKRALDKHVKSVGDFSKEHPILSVLGTMGVATVAMLGFGKLYTKGLNKLVSTLPKEKLDKAAVELAQKLNKNKVLNGISKKLAKVPSGIKNFAAGVIDYSPMLLVATSIVHSFSHQNAKNLEVQNNYRDLKIAQAQAREYLENKAEAEAETAEQDANVDDVE